MAELAAPPHAFDVPPVRAPGEDDLHLTLYLLYELHYRGLPGVDERWEWNSSLVELRTALEAVFEAALRADVPVPAPCAPEDTDVALRAIGDADDGPALSTWVERNATREQVLEWLVHKSPYQLKEADPHSWVIPRLSGRA